MRIAVVEHPRIASETRFNDIANTPLWSCLMGRYAASNLIIKGHNVSFIDAVFWTFNKLGDHLESLDPELILINAVYFWEHTPQFFSWLKNLRLSGLQGHICLMGFFPTLAYESILETFPEVDSIIIGECEITAIELAEALSQSRHLNNIAGLALRGSNKVAQIKREPTRDLDELAFPLWPRLDTTISILASRGCYNHCSFCPVPVFYNEGALWRGRTPQNVFDEILLLHERGGREFYFVDPNFIGPGIKGKNRTIELMNLLHPLDITFGMETRPNDLDNELLEVMLKSGLQSLLLGIESGSSDVLTVLNKSAVNSSSERAIALCRAFGLEPEIGFLMFVPDSTVEDIKWNLEFLYNQNLLDRLDRTANLLCHHQIILKGTADYQRFHREKRIKDSGFLGFEAVVTYKDSRVYWMSTVIAKACLHILKDMSRPDSIIYWKKAQDYRAFGALNKMLLEIFEEVLLYFEKPTSDGLAVEGMTFDIIEKLNAELLMC
jgi:anaerobic magnesium-protoporphyrin IX monomethyl ester cyclase